MPLRKWQLSLESAGVPAGRFFTRKAAYRTASKLAKMMNANAIELKRWSGGTWHMYDILPPQGPDVKKHHQEALELGRLRLELAELKRQMAEDELRQNSNPCANCDERRAAVNDYLCEVCRDW